MKHSIIMACLLTVVLQQAHAVDPVEALKGIRSDIKAAEFKKAYSSLHTGDIFNGVPLTKSFCDVAYDKPLQAGCDALTEKMKAVGADKFDPNQVAADKVKWDSATGYVDSTSSYKVAKSFVAEMQKKYGPFAIFERTNQALDAKLPSFQDREQKETAARKAEAKKKADEENKLKAEQAAADARFKKAAEDRKQREAKDNSPACKAARLKSDYCTRQMVAERAQANIDRERKVGEASGFVRKDVLHKNASFKMDTIAAAEEAASQYKEMTGGQLNVADCKIGRVPSGYPGFKTAAIDPNVEKILKDDVVRNCGKSD